MLYLIGLLFCPQIIALQRCPLVKDLIPTKESNKTMPKGECLKELKGMATTRNFFNIRSYESNDPITLICESCEPNSLPYWYFIARNTKQLVDYSFDIVHGSNLFLLQKGERVKDDNVYCLTAKNGLTIKSFDAERVLGTYYCSDGNASLVSYVWHHVDTYFNVDDPRISQAAVMHKAYSKKQVDTALENIEDELKRKFPTSIYEGNLAKIFYAFEKKPSIKGLCGDVRIKYVRRCNIQMPQNMTESRPFTKAEYATYFTVLEAVKDIIEYKSMSEKKDGRSFIAAKIKANNIADSLGFTLMESERDIVIPCHLSFFKHLETVPKLGNPFNVPNQYGLVETQLKCPEVDPMDIIKLAMARDIGKLRMQVLGEIQKAMRAIDKIFLQGSKNEKLICGYTNKKGDVCSNRRLDVQWRLNDYVFTIESVVKQRVYVTSHCELFFVKMRLRDRGAYTCFRKSMDNTSWNISPTTKFLVQIERAKNPLPEMKMVLKYFAVLVMWTAFIFALWISLTVIHMRIKVNARYRTEERMLLLQTEARRRRQKATNVPKVDLSSGSFLDEIRRDKKIS